MVTAAPAAVPIGIINSAVALREMVGGGGARPSLAGRRTSSDPPTRGCRTNAACIATTGPAFVSSLYLASHLVDGRPLIEAVSDLRGGIPRRSHVAARHEWHSCISATSSSPERYSRQRPARDGQATR